MQVIADALRNVNINSNLEPVIHTDVGIIYRVAVESVSAIEQRQHLEQILISRVGYWPIFFDGGPQMQEFSQDRIPSSNNISIKEIIEFVETNIGYPFSNKPDESWFNSKTFSVEDVLVDDESILREPIDRMIVSSILLVPTRTHWHIPAILRYSAASIPPTFHCTCMKYWHAKYGAEIVWLEDRNITMQVKRSPSTPLEALYLAWEHQKYCPNLRIDDIDIRAKSLFFGEPWEFWWD